MKPKEIGVFEAKTRLSALLEKVEKGQAYVICKRGRPVAELRPVARGAQLEFGCDAGRIAIRSDFEAPVPELLDYSE